MGYINQIKGYDDGPVPEEYQKYVKDFVDKSGFEISINFRDWSLVGLVKIDGKVYKLNNLPDNLKVDGDLNLSGVEITKLPDNLKFGGSLDLSSTKITKLPDNLKVRGDLDLSHTNIAELPDNLSVGGSLFLGRTKITKLPDNLSVGRNLFLGDLIKKEDIPATVKIGGRVYD